MSCRRGRTQPLPFSTGAILSFGKRVHMPWPMADATVSVIGAVAGVGDGGEGAAAGERRELVVPHALPLVDVALVAAVGRVHADDDVLLLHQLPERVELGQRERPRAPGSPGTGAGRTRMILAPRSVTHSSSSIAFSTIGQRDHGRGEDAVLVVEGPRLVHPLVEGVDHDVGGLGIVAEALLHEAGEGGPHERPVEAELVHQLEPRGGLPEGRRCLDGLAHDLAAGLALGVADLEVLLLGARRGHAARRWGSGCSR